MIARGLFAIAIVAGAAVPAWAGDWCGSTADEMELPTKGKPEGEPVEAMKWIEHFAKSKKWPAPEDDDPWMCAETDAIRLRPRIVAACTVIVKRDGETSPCITLLAFAGLSTFGTHDVYALVMADRKDNPVYATSGQWSEPGILTKLGDPRGAKRLVDEWTAAIPEAAKREKRKNAMMSWSSWRQQAARALGVLGDADVVAFLRAQAAATVDKHVAKACTDAAAAIDKRLAKPAAP